MKIRRRRRRLLILLLALPPLLSPGCAARRPMQSDFGAVIHCAQERVFPALVFIKPIKEHLATGERIQTRTFGSGIIISPDGLVVTNSHVARNAKEIKCVLFNKQQLPARVVGYDEVIDLALLQLKLPDGHPPLPTVAFADSDTLTEGQFVMALGSPLGFTRSISFGIISSARRYLDTGFYHLWIQTDAAINPGNSGGPLVDDQGRVIGINTLKARRGDNIGFAIPANTVTEIVSHLRENHRVIRSYSGLHFQAVKDFIRDTVLDYDTGVLVGSVDDNSPAAAAGIRAGDLILACNDITLAGIYLENLPPIRSYFAYLKAGQPAQIVLQRMKQKLAVALTPVEKPAQTREGVELKEWNCSIQNITTFRTPALAYYAPRGVYVLGVRRPGNAYDSGLGAGDIILAIDRNPVSSLAGLQQTYRALTRLDRGKRTALLEILRKGYHHTIVLDFNRDHTSFK